MECEPKRLSESEFSRQVRAWKQRFVNRLRAAFEGWVERVQDMAKAKPMPKSGGQMSGGTGMHDRRGEARLSVVKRVRGRGSDDFFGNLNDRRLDRSRRKP